MFRLYVYILNYLHSRQEKTVNRKFILRREA